MALIEFTLDTAAQQIETVAAELTACGFEEMVIEDQDELEGFLENNREYWDYIDESLQKQLQGLSRIRLYIEETDTDRQERLRMFTEERNIPVSEKKMPDVNWNESWRENYPPQEIGRDLVVLPYWLADTYDGTRKQVILDPGLTFGTGAHPSTQMVMETMEDLVKPGDRCLDLGSGSGILSITALRLGAAFAEGIDIDPKAEDIARENAAYNGFGQEIFTAATGNITADKALMQQLSAQSWQIVLVNIVADVIISLAPVLPGFMGNSTHLILSGILDTRLQDVRAALEKAGLKVQHIREKEEWRCVLCSR